MIVQLKMLSEATHGGYCVLDTMRYQSLDMKFIRERCSFMQKLHKIQALHIVEDSRWLLGVSKLDHESFPSNELTPASPLSSSRILKNTRRRRRRRRGIVSARRTLPSARL